MIYNLMFLVAVLILLVASPLTLPRSSKEKQMAPQDDWELMRAVQPESPNVDRRPALNPPEVHPDL